MRRDEALAILAAHRKALKGFGIKSLAIFGSVARDEAALMSNVDILVEFEQPVGLFEFIEVKEYLEGLLERPVDLVTPAALRPQLRERVMLEAVYAA